MKSYSSDTHNYILGKADDLERSKLEHEIYQGSFKAILELVLDEYGLAAVLEKAKVSGDKVVILDIGSNQGYYLQDTATLLEARGLETAALLVGIDLDRQAISNAEAANKRPYVRFFVQDATQPLTTDLNFQFEGLKSFDSST